MIDTALVTRKCVLILQDVDRMSEVASGELASFLADPVLQPATERYLERTIGRMIDVNFHVLTELGHAPPADYFKSFTELGAIGVLDASFASSIARAAGLRNRIAHEYDAVDPKIVFESLPGIVADVRRYVADVQQFVNRTP